MMSNSRCELQDDRQIPFLIIFHVEAELENTTHGIHVLEPVETYRTSTPWMNLKYEGWSLEGQTAYIGSTVAHCRLLNLVMTPETFDSLGDQRHNPPFCRTQDSDQWQNHKWFATALFCADLTKKSNSNGYEMPKPQAEHSTGWTRWSWGHGSIQRIHGRTPCWAYRRTPPAALRSRSASHGTTCRLSEEHCCGTWATELLDRRRMNTHTHIYIYII